MVAYLWCVIKVEKADMKFSGHCRYWYYHINTLHNMSLANPSNWGTNVKQAQAYNGDLGY